MTDPIFLKKCYKSYISKIILFDFYSRLFHLLDPSLECQEHILMPSNTFLEIVISTFANMVLLTVLLCCFFIGVSVCC